MQFARSWCGLALVLASACGDGSVGQPGDNGPGSADGDGADSPGDGDGDGSSTGGDGDNPGGDGDNPGGDGDGFCEELAVSASPAIPDMLIVLDRSGSMQSEGVDRWTPSVNAVGTLTSDYEEKVRFGLMLFPSEGDSCGAGDLLVPVTINAADDIAESLFFQATGGGTPTSATLERAYDVIGAGQPPLPDLPPTVKFVMLVTDGQPTCPGAQGFIDAPQGRTQEEHDLLLQQDYEDTLTAIEALAEAGVKTYVIGYDADLNPDLVAALSAFADVGLTGDYHAVQNEAELTAEFDKISGEVVSCSYTLEKEPEDPRFVEVRLDGQQLNLDDPDGWSILERTITVQGAACATLQNGGDHNLNVSVQCEVVIPE